MKNFMKDIRDLSKLKTSEIIVAMYEQGQITLPEAVQKMKGLRDVVELLKGDDHIVGLAKGLDTGRDY